jgi:hypothetical protein
METKQTAVQILVESMTTSDISFYSKEIAIALQMEREQIIEAYVNIGFTSDYDYAIAMKKKAEQYYNAIYGGKDE